MALQGIQAAELSKNSNIGEIFGVARFSTFSTVSAHSGTTTSDCRGGYWGHELRGHRKSVGC